MVRKKVREKFFVFKVREMSGNFAFSVEMVRCDISIAFEGTFIVWYIVNRL